MSSPRILMYLLESQSEEAQTYFIINQSFVFTDANIL